MEEISSLNSIFSQSKSDIDLSDTELNELVCNAKGTSSEGGLFLPQTSGALKILLEDRKNVHVIYNKNAFGDPEMDSFFLLQDLLKIISKPRYIVFPFAITRGHQISVVIDYEENKMIVTDSLKADRSKDKNLLKIKNAAGIQEIVNGNPDSYYMIQKDNWACGIFTVCNSIHRVNQECGKENLVLDVDKYVEGILIASEKYSKIEMINQMEREERKKQKRDLLEHIEHLRDQNGHFRNPDSFDDLRKVADSLQLESWGNLDRRYPKDNPNRSQDQLETIRERDIKLLVENYEKEHKEDVLGIIILYTLMRGGRYEDVIKFQQDAVQSGIMGYRLSEKTRSHADRSINLAKVYVTLSRPEKAKEIFIDVMEENKDNPSHAERISIFFVCFYYLAGIAMSLNQEEVAVNCYNKAMDVVQSLMERDDECIALCLKGLGDVYRLSGQLDKALSQYERALSIFTDVFGDSDLHVAYSLNAIGSVYVKQRKLLKAVECNTRAKEIFEQVHGPDSFYVAMILETLGIVYLELDQLELSDKSTSDAKDIYECIFGPNHPKVGAVLNNLGSVFYKSGNIKKAKEYFEKADMVLREFYETEHVTFATCLSNLGSCYSSEGQDEQAINCFLKVNEILSKPYGPMNPCVVHNLNRLGEVYAKLGNIENAWKCFSRCISIFKDSFKLESLELGACQLVEVDQTKKSFQETKQSYKKLSDDNKSDLADCLSHVAHVHLRRGQYEKSVDCLKAAKAIKESVFGTNHHKIASLLTNMGLGYLRLKSYKQAIECLVRSKEIYSNCRSPSEEGLAECCNNLGQAYTFTDNWQEAAIYFEKAVGLARNVFGSNHAIVAARQYNLGQLYNKMQKIDGAIECFEDARRIYHIDGDTMEYNVSMMLKHLTFCYEKKRNFEAAVRCMEEAKDRDSKMHGPRHESVRDCLVALIELLNMSSIIQKEEKIVQCRQELELIQKGNISAPNTDVAKELQELGTLHLRMKQYEEAKSYLTKAKDLYTEETSLYNPNTASCLTSLGILYCNQEMFEEAWVYFTEARTIYEILFGPQHTTVAQCLRNLGNVHLQMGNLSEAINALDEAKEIFKKLYGSNHETVEDCIQILTMLYLQL